MISRVDLRGKDTDPRDVLPRAALDVEAALAAVRPICQDVRDRGAEAVRDITERLDGVRLRTSRMPPEALKRALDDLPSPERAALEEAAGRVRRVHQAQRRDDVTVTVSPGGTVVRYW